MADYKFQSKSFLWLGYAILACFIIMSIIFFKERVIHTDNAFQHFLMLKENFPQIMESRYGMMLIKLPAFLFLIAGGSVGLSLVVYSVSFYVIYTLAYFLLENKANNSIFAWLVIFCLTVMMSYDFYWCASEQIPGLILLLFVIGLINNKTVNKYWWLIGLSITAVLNFFHPLIILPAFFLLLYLMLEYKQIKNPKYLSLFGFIFLSFIIKRLFFTGAYDSERMSKFISRIDQYLFKFWEIPSFKGFLQACISEYYLFFPLLIISVYLLLKNKAYFQTFLLFGFIGLHLLIISLNEPIIYVPYYAESNFIVFGIYVSIPILFELHKKNMYKFMLAIMIISSFTSIIRMYSHHRPFSERVQFLQELVSTSNAPKSYIPWEDKYSDLLTTEWGVPYETALLSAIDSKYIYKTVYMYKDSVKLVDGLNKEDAFISVFSVDDCTTFYNRWIKIPKSSYQKLSD